MTNVIKMERKGHISHLHIETTSNYVPPLTQITLQLALRHQISYYIGKDCMSPKYNLPFQPCLKNQESSSYSTCKTCLQESGEDASYYI